LKRRLTPIRAADEEAPAELWAESTKKELNYCFKSVSIQIFLGSVEQERVIKR